VTEATVTILDADTAEEVYITNGDSRYRGESYHYNYVSISADCFALNSVLDVRIIGKMCMV
jgi:hypothetical protein